MNIDLVLEIFNLIIIPIIIYNFLFFHIDREQCSLKRENLNKN